MKDGADEEGPLCSYCDERVSIPSIRKLIVGLSLLICDDCLRECFRNAVTQGWVLKDDMADK